MLIKINYLNMRIKMFISSYFPLYIILLVLNIEEYNSCDKLVKILRFEGLVKSIFIITLIVLSIISLKSLIDLKKTKGVESQTFSNINTPDDTIISYMMTYIVPLLSSDFLESKTVIINVSLFLLIGFMYVKLNLIYLNPLWLLNGYFVYRDDNELIIITNITYSDFKSLSGEELKSTLLGGKIYLVQKSDNNI